MNFLTEQDFETPQAFLNKIQSLPVSVLINLNSNETNYDNLTTEQSDMISFEILRREHAYLDQKKQEMKQRGYSEQQINRVESRDKTESDRPDTDFIDMRGKGDLNKKLKTMPLDLLERSKEEMANHVINYDPNGLNMDKRQGINIRHKNISCKPLAESDGDTIIIDNERIQEIYRSNYLHELNGQFGTNIGEYDKNILFDEIENKYGDVSFVDEPVTVGDLHQNSNSLYNNINEDEYEDD